MAATREHFGDIANVAQLTGLDAVRLIGLIGQAASRARMHKKNCKQFAKRLEYIEKLLPPVRLSELKKYPETQKPLEQFEVVLRSSYILVKSCQDLSYLYLLANGWSIVNQFRRATDEIDFFLKLVPLLHLNAQVRERSDDEDRRIKQEILDDENRRIMQERWDDENRRIKQERLDDENRRIKQERLNDEKRIVVIILILVISSFYAWNSWS